MRPLKLQHRQVRPESENVQILPDLLTPTLPNSNLTLINVAQLCQTTLGKKVLEILCDTSERVGL